MNAIKIKINAVVTQDQNIEITKTIKTPFGRIISNQAICFTLDEWRDVLKLLGKELSDQELSI